MLGPWLGAIVNTVATPPAPLPPPPPPPGSRLVVFGRELQLDGRRYLMRGVAYSPTPIGLSASAGNSLDMFSNEHAEVHQRDMPLLAGLGANTLRLNSFDGNKDHSSFFHACALHNLTLLASFEITSLEFALGTELGRKLAKANLERILDLVSHPAITTWLIGSGLNAPAAGFVCDPHPAPCQFNGTDVLAFYAVIDSLCAIVRARGLRCSSPVADIPMPELHALQVAGSYSVGDGAARWIHEVDPSLAHMDIWSADLYTAPADLDTFIVDYASSSSRPFFLSGYGVDAFDSGWGDGGVRKMTEAQDEQARALQQLSEGLERHSVTCLIGCEDVRVVSGGVVNSFVDEYDRGAGMPLLPANGPFETVWWFDADAAPYWKCPESDTQLHSPCGYPVGDGADDFANLEWYGLLATQPGCPPPNDPPVDTASVRVPVDRVTPRTAYYMLAVMWTLGSCAVQDPGAVPPWRQAYWEGDFASYPQCNEAVRSARSRFELPQSRSTNCDYMDYVRQLGNICPPLPTHVASTSAGVSIEPAVMALRHPPPSPCNAAAQQGSIQTFLDAFVCANYTGAMRLQVVPSGGKGTAEQSRAELSRAEQGRAEPSRAKQCKAVQNRAKQS